MSPCRRLLALQVVALTRCKLKNDGGCRRIEKMLLLLAKEDIIPFNIPRQHRAKMSFSIWCPSCAPNTSPGDLCFDCCCWVFIMFCSAFLGCVLPDWVTQHWLALQTAILLTVKWQTTHIAGEKRATNLLTCTSPVWHTHCVHTALILSSFVWLPGPSKSSGLAA